MGTIEINECVANSIAGSNAGKWIAQGQHKVVVTGPCGHCPDCRGGKTA